MTTIVKIKRGNEPTLDILEDGEMAYNRVKKCFYVGDGKTKMIHLKEFNNIVKGDNGKMYLVSVDENGNPTVKEMIQYINENKFEFYAE